jgi:hypothetical protein
VVRRRRRRQMHKQAFPHGCAARLHDEEHTARR